MRLEKEAYEQEYQLKEKATRLAAEAATKDAAEQEVARLEQERVQ